MPKASQCCSQVSIRFAALSIATAVAITGCSTSGRKVQKSSSANDATPQPYMRVVHSDSGDVQLQIALRELRPARRSGPTIWLVAVSHIGEIDYYAALQKHLDMQTRVLFEGVGDRHARAASESSPEHLSNNEVMRGDSDEGQSSLQSTLAHSLGLAFQLDTIDYDRPHFHNSDLTISQIQALLTRSAKNAPPLADASTADPGDQLGQLVGLMDGSSLLGAIVHMGVKLIGSSPKLQALTKIAVIETFGNLEGDISQSAALPPGMKKLIDVLIQGRNQVVVHDLKAELPKLRK